MKFQIFLSLVVAERVLKGGPPSPMRGSLPLFVLCSCHCLYYVANNPQILCTEGLLYSQQELAGHLAGHLTGQLAGLLTGVLTGHELLSGPKS